MWFLLEGWFYNEPRPVITARIKRLFANQGLPLDDVINRQASTEVMVSDTKVTIEISRYTENHTLFRMRSERITQAIHDLFNQVFEQLAVEQNPNVSELIFGWHADELSPLITHSHWRGEYPGPLALLDEKTLASTMLNPAQDQYWIEVGPRLHYIHQKTLNRHSNISLGVLADRVGRPARATPYGVLFDCGWSLRWPTGMPTHLLSDAN